MWNLITTSPISRWTASMFVKHIDLAHHPAMHDEMVFSESLFSKGKRENWEMNKWVRKVSALGKCGFMFVYSFLFCSRILINLIFSL